MKKIIISICLMILPLSALGMSFDYQAVFSQKYLNKSEKNLYKSLKYEKDFDKFLSKSAGKNVDKKFEKFFKYLLDLEGNIDVSKLKLTENENGFTKSISPKTNLFYFQANDIITARIDYNYFNGKYLKYLSPQWQEFMLLAANNKEISYSSAVVDANYKEIVDWIISWQNFIKKYPDFPMKDYIQSEIKYFTAYGIILNKYSFKYTPDNSMGKEYRQGYLEFLNRVDKNSKEYFVVKKCYDILKANKFKETKEFDNTFIEYAGIEYYKFIKNP